VRGDPQAGGEEGANAARHQRGHVLVRSYPLRGSHGERRAPDGARIESVEFSGGDIAASGKGAESLSIVRFRGSGLRGSRPGRQDSGEKYAKDSGKRGASHGIRSVKGIP